MVKSLSIVTMDVHAAKVRNAVKLQQNKVQRLSPVRGYGDIAIGVRRNS